VVSKKNTSSRFRGVSWNKERNKWKGAIKYKDIGRYDCFEDESDAARWYDEQAIDLYGITACVNFPSPDPITDKLLAQRKLKDSANHIKEVGSNPKSCQKRRRDAENSEVGDLEPVSKLARVVEIH